MNRKAEEEGIQAKEVIEKLSKSGLFKGFQVELTILEEILQLTST